MKEIQDLLTILTAHQHTLENLYAKSPPGFKGDLGCAGIDIVKALGLVRLLAVKVKI